MLGAATPAQSLARAVRDTEPAAIVLWSQRPDTAAPEALAALQPYAVPVYTAGPGWPSPPSPGTRHLTSLTEALQVLTDPSPGTRT
jgi:hypothetical protein